MESRDGHDHPPSGRGRPCPWQDFVERLECTAVELVQAFGNIFDLVETRRVTLIEQGTHVGLRRDAID